MQYTKYTFTILSEDEAPTPETISDLLSAELAEVGFDSFEWGEDANALYAYVPTSEASDECVADVVQALGIDACHITFESEVMPDVNWNEEWEKHYFQPILIDEGRCVIRAPFHEAVPGAEVEILISPRMAFGTGNHATTVHVVRYLLDHRADLVGAAVLDMGCGTGILGILALKLGADTLTAIDIDEWAYRNVLDNAELNGVSIPDALQGDASSLAGRGPYALVLANITRNILLEDMPAYAEVMSRGARLVMSGFYEADIELIVARASELGLTYISSAVSPEGWSLVEVKKS